MTSRERMNAATTDPLDGRAATTTWCFGFRAPEHLRWEREGVAREFWYTQRLEHIHTLPQPWTLEDDFQRVLAWRTLGMDDVLDVSVPWSVSPEATWQDSVLPRGQVDPRYPVLRREYQTPAGPVRHAVRQTGAEPAGWVVQPDHVPLFEDYNIPRAIEQPVSSPAQVPAMRYLYTPPDAAAREWFARKQFDHHRAGRVFGDVHHAGRRRGRRLGWTRRCGCWGRRGRSCWRCSSPRRWGS